VLKVLWSRGPGTVRQVHEVLYGGTETGYTTTLKLLQNLHAKGLVSRDGRARQHVYEATVTQQATMRDVLRTLIDRSFEGSAATLAMHALGAKPASPQELADLKALIRRLEQEGRR
jgi:predicted transcriptional regulator